MSTAKTAWIASCSALILASLIVGIMTRQGFTDYTTDVEALEQLPYLASTYSVTRIDDDNAFFGSDFRNVENALEEADVVIAGTFTGNRVYSYQAFLSTVRVDKVYKGGGRVSEGSDIGVFEPMSIVSFDSVAVLPQGAYTSGLPPMRQEAKYVLLLDEMGGLDGGSPGELPQFRFYAEQDSGLSVLSRVCLESEINPFVGNDPSKTYGESLGIDIFAADEDSLADYLDICRRLVASANSMSQARQ
ncbi:MAG: hypothetical protein HFJ72_01110 [Adlercreutzia sp.]|nr:hypothetical protein [Adlercreutzia sp.]